MAKLQRQIESYKKNSNGKYELQILMITANANSREEAAELTLDDFEIDLFIDHMYKGEISNVLGKSGGLEAIIEEFDWEQIYCDENKVHEAA